MLRTTCVIATFACGCFMEASAGEISANVTLASDYVFRGVSLSDREPAVQGGFDWVNDAFYAGAWGSSLQGGSELDLYVGWRPQWGPIDFDIAATSFFYPGAADDEAEFDYIEMKAAAAWTLSSTTALGAEFYWAPENYGDTGVATYVEANASYAVTESINLSGAFGLQRVEDPDGPFGLAATDAYRTWNVGAEFSAAEFTIDLRYHDTDIEAADDIEAYTYGPSSYDASWVLSVTRGL